MVKTRKLTELKVKLFQELNALMHRMDGKLYTVPSLVPTLGSGRYLDKRNVSNCCRASVFGHGWHSPANIGLP